MSMYKYNLSNKDDLKKFEEEATKLILNMLQCPEEFGFGDMVVLNSGGFYVSIGDSENYNYDEEDKNPEIAAINVQIYEDEECEIDVDGGGVMVFLENEDKDIQYAKEKYEFLLELIETC